MKGHCKDPRLSKHKKHTTKVINIIKKMIDDDYYLRRSPNNYVGTDDDLNNALRAMEIYRLSLRCDV